MIQDLCKRKGSRSQLRQLPGWSLLPMYVSNTFAKVPMPCQSFKKQGVPVFTIETPAFWVVLMAPCVQPLRRRISPSFAWMNVKSESLTLQPRGIVNCHEGKRPFWGHIEICPETGNLPIHLSGSLINSQWICSNAWPGPNTVPVQLCNWSRSTVPTVSPAGPRDLPTLPVAVRGSETLECSVYVTV